MWVDTNGQSIQGCYRVSIAGTTKVCASFPKHATGEHRFWSVRDSNKTPTGKAPQVTRGQLEQGDQAESGIDGTVFEISNSFRLAIL